jgi:hypothetical protein
MFLRAKLTRNLTDVLLTVLFLGAAGSVWAANNRLDHDSAAIGMQEVGFTLTRLPENPKKYSLVLSDSDEHTISGHFSVEQLQVLRAIMVEAEKLALNGEATGSTEPVTTRFMDKQETAFIVDVEKLGARSKLFLTLKTEIGRMTTEAGKIFRTTRREEGFFFELLSQLESVLPKLAVQPSK